MSWVPWVVGLIFLFLLIDVVIDASVVKVGRLVCWKSDGRRIGVRLSLSGGEDTPVK